MTLQFTPLVFPLLTWLFSLAGTALALSMLRQYAVMDNPNARSNHTIPVPRGGGIAMILFALMFLAASNVPVCIILAAVLLATISFVDDLRGVKVYIRFGVQFIAVIVAMPALKGHLFPYYIPHIAEQIFIALFWIWFINLNNFMDGIDGISSMQAIITSAGICLLVSLHKTLPPTLAIHASIIAAAVLGFFWFNRHPAKLFMGDVGSITLGFLIFYLLITLSLHGAWVAALLLPAYYVCDATFTLIKRAVRGEKVWQAHSEHAYQHAVRRGLTHTQVVRKITLLNICLVALAISATLNMMISKELLTAGYIMTACTMGYLMYHPRRNI